MGSSPRAWGTQIQASVEPLAQGLIPTGVGNTTTSPAPLMVTQAHPHGRGEHRERWKAGF